MEGSFTVGLLDYGKIIITIILVNIEITIIQTIAFEFENVMHLLRKKIVTQSYEISA
jgi:hypothetical protein